LPIQLSAEQARVIGWLMEKSVVTPAQYPLTLNALTNACNQKSSRHPVMSLSQGEVQRTVRQLQDAHLIAVEENFKSQVEKYSQRLCNTPFSQYQFDPAQFSIICTLLLRGPRTPGELRANSGRLHEFADNHAVSDTLGELLNAEAGPLVVQLPRTPGRRDAEFMHLLSGDVGGDVDGNVGGDVAGDAGGDVDIQANQPTAPAEPATAPVAATATEPTGLTERVSRLEQQVAELQNIVAHLSSSANSTDPATTTNTD